MRLSIRQGMPARAASENILATPSPRRPAGSAFSQLKESLMPVITVQMLSGRTPEQKRSFIKQVAEIAVKTLDVPARAVTIVITESSPDDWGSGGTTMAELRSRPPGALSL